MGVRLVLWAAVLCMELCYGGVAQWCPGECSCYNAYTTIDCSRAELTFVPMLPNTTTHLYMENNRLHRLPVHAFHEIPNALVLNLQSNQLTAVDASAFAGLRRLQDLNLSQNRLKLFTVSFTLDVTLVHLRDLDLSGNRLWTIPRNLSYFAPNIQILNLSYNQIASGWLDASYSGMTALHTLDLTGNPLHTLASYHFQVLRWVPLDTLRLIDCALVHMEPTTFTSMVNLTSLVLSHNTINPKMLAAALAGFTNTSHLANLDLSNMALPNITQEMLSSFSKLEVLILSNNTIDFIDPDVFTHLENLQTLELQENKLRFVDNITSLCSLRRLNLQKNALQAITVSGLANLELLDLSYNRIETIPYKWISHTDSLRVINLSHNSIRHINQHAFQKVTLEHLNLSHNRLSVLHNLGMLKVSTLIVSHNRIQSIEDSAFDHLEATLEELDLSFNELTHLPDHTFHDFVSLQRLNLAHNNLGRAFELGIHAGLFNSLSHLQVLDLSANNITTLPQDQFHVLQHLTTLYLHSNRAHQLHDLALDNMRSLAKLDVSNNSLPTVDTRVLMELDYLETVDLGGNPYQCTCGLLHFLHWLNTTVVTVQGIQEQSNYTCVSPSQNRGQFILNYHPKAAECLRPTTDITWDLTIFGITVVVVTSLTVLTALIIHYGKLCQRIKSLHYRWQIRYREVSGIEIADPKV